MADITVSQDIDNLMQAGNASEARTQLGLGSASTSDSTDFGSSTDVTANTSARHTHSNKATLDATEESYTTADKAKVDSALESIVAGANVAVDNSDPQNPVVSSLGGGGAVDSVNTQTGVVVLDADDIDDASTTNKFATQAQLANADSALQNGDNITELANNAGYITSAPVDSVNGDSGTVVLDADDIDDSLTTNKFATQAQLDNADSALQSSDNVSELTNNVGYITSAPVDSVNTQTGAVVLDADDIDDASTTNKFATQAQLDNADSALQAGDNVSVLTNDSGYITSAPVDSVNTQTGAVVLDADDIDDTATTNKFATQAQLDNADSALQPTDPTLESVTNNGSTTTNDISVGGRFTTGNNTAVGSNATAIGGANNTASGPSSEVLGGDGSTASGQGATVVGGSSHSNSGNWSASIGGLNQTTTAVRAGIFAGFGNTNQHNDSTLLGCINRTSVAVATTHVESLHLFGGFKMPTGATDGYVLTSDANGVGTWQVVAGVQSLSSSSGVLTIDYSQGSNVKTTLTESITSIAITNAVEGDSGLIIFTTDGLATHTMAVGSSNRVLSGYVSDFSLLTTSDKITMGYYYDGTEMYLYISQVG